MAKITIYKPSKTQGEEYLNAQRISIKNGILSFYEGKTKYTTTVPFVIEDAIPPKPKVTQL